MTDVVFETRGLTRYFGKKCALRDLSLSLSRGCVLGFLGRNGSGKTTAIRMLLGFLPPTRGSATLLGHDCRDLPPEVRARVGHMAEGHPVYGWMTPAETGAFQAKQHPGWDPGVFNNVLEHFRIAGRTRARTLSRGQRAGLCLAMTLAQRPEVLVLDDPALGLDAVARRALLQAMVHFTKEEGRAILFSSHMLADVERVADRIAILDQGVLKANCPVDAFRDRMRQVVVQFRDAPANIPEVAGLLSSVRRGNELVMTIANYGPETEQSLERCGALRFETVEMGLEDAFLGYLGNRGEQSFLLSGIGGEV